MKQFPFIWRLWCNSIRRDTCTVISHFIFLHWESPSYSLLILTVCTPTLNQFFRVEAVKEISKASRSPHFHQEILMRLDIHLTHNEFQFNLESFLQIRGTAMGRNFALAYANTYMATVAGSKHCLKNPAFYFRYLDDIFGIWPHRMDTFTEFYDIANNH